MRQGPVIELIILTSSVVQTCNLRDDSVRCERILLLNLRFKAAKAHTAI